MALQDYLAQEIAQDCVDGHLSRREALRRLVLLGVGATAAGVLLTGCADDETSSVNTTTTTGTPAPPTTVTAGTSPPPTAGSATAGPVTFAGPSGELQGAFAAPAQPTAAVLVIHENRGLTPHFFDLVGRFGDEGYAALCVDLLSAEGGTATFVDEGAAQAALGAAPLERLLGDLRAGIDELVQRAPGAKVGAVGFCFGGGMSWSLLAAGESRLAAVVPFYGPAPAGADFSGAQAAVLGIYAELDTRVNASRDQADAALAAAGLTYEIHTIPGVDHAFFNNTGARYNAAAADETWLLMLDWFSRYLA